MTSFTTSNNNNGNNNKINDKNNNEIWFANKKQKQEKHCHSATATPTTTKMSSSLASISASSSPASSTRSKTAIGRGGTKNGFPVTTNMNPTRRCSNNSSSSNNSSKRSNKNLNNNSKNGTKHPKQQKQPSTPVAAATKEASPPPPSPSPNNNDSNSNNNNNSITIRTQTQVQNQFSNVLQQEGIYRKSAAAYLRPAKMGEQIVTSVQNGIVETTNTVTQDHSWIACGKTFGEFYILTPKDFESSYDVSTAKPIEVNSTTSSSSSSSSPQEQQLQTMLIEKGFLEYKSKRKVYAHVVTEKDLKWFQQQIDKNGTRFAQFMAPWGEPMRVEVGDMIVMQYTNGDDGIKENHEVYRVQKDAFEDTYEPVSTTTTSL